MSPRARRLAIHALYFGLSLLFATRVFSLRHPGSHAIMEGDPALMCWTLQWVSHALVHAPAQLYAGNVFYPYARSITLSDPMITLGVANVPVQLVTANPWIGYNLLLLLAYYLSCVWGAALAREITGSEPAAVWGGIFWGFLFFRVHHIGHLQILSFEAMPLAILMLLRFAKRPSARAAAGLAVAFCAQALVSWYLAVILAIVLAIVGVLALGRAPVTRALARHYPLIGAILAVVIVPFAWPYRAAFANSTLADRLKLVSGFGDAVHLRDFLTPPVPTLLGRFVTANPYWIWGENTLYVGIVPLLLAAAALVHARRRGPGPRWAITGAALVAAGYVLALGFVSPSLGIRLPLHYLAVLFPMIGGMRATQRFALVLYSGVLILSSVGLAQTIRSWSPRWQRLAAGVLCAAFLVDVFPLNLPFGPTAVYAVSQPDRFIARYQRTRPEPLVVLHLPIHYFDESYPVSEAVYMLDSTAHWARILNGFSGGVPDGFMDRMAVLNTLPSPRAVDLLVSLGVDVVAVHGAAARPGTPLLDYFSHQAWAAVVPLPTGEFVVLINRAHVPAGLARGEP